MLRIMLKSKIHRARVTETNLYYEGSITIDEDLMKAANICDGEKVEVLNVNNGLRLETYAIKGKAGSGVICLNGPSARGSCEGDQVIVLCYVLVDDKEVNALQRKIIKVNEQNQIKN
ncbi:MAG: aspartate 1-decarboxylase [Candidatus Omnitrophica bacterium]|nr:aspartate 1-decarboxylase [Candidatus Omnitrophota bacterium]MBU1090600.1 aspartate 1-decarboxylase [Candidatus Omnitrophota bacterium]MBU1906136.1 aspartate 1-decarboxylase [Candidatus Omnitrophota bacterium]